jgi:hypothetical protein
LRIKPVREFTGRALKEPTRGIADPLPDGVRAYLQGVEPTWLRDSLLT